MQTLSSFSVKLFNRNTLPTTRPKQTRYFYSLIRSTMNNSSSVAVYFHQSEHVAGAWYSVPDLRLRDHRFTVPLDYSRTQSPKISVFAREAVSVGKENQDMPYLLYLQGGPGFESPRPTEASGWLSKACEEHHVILMDQRGTGLSTPLTTSSMLQMKSAQELVDYLKYFRADNIVNDAEFIRKRLVPKDGPWKVLGQSFGGFCGVTYLSFAPKGLQEVYLTGGIPPIGDGCTAEAVYKACIGPIITQNEKYYKRYPQDIEIIRDVVNHLQETEGGGVPLPSGGILTPRGLQLLGLTGLGSSMGFERLHYLFERVWDPVIVPGAKKQISYYFLNAFETWLSFDTNPLYALMHESIYCQGAASRWAAHRVRVEHEHKFDAVKATKEGRPVFLIGEMVFPWMFDEIHALRPFKEAANLLAEKKDWPPLYNKTALNKNTVPVAAAVYYEDMFVNFNLAMETAAEIAGIRLWVTNEYMHSGLRDGATHVLDHLMGLLNDVSCQCITFKADVNVSNPYGTPIPICEISYTFKSAGRVIVEGSIPDHGTLKANSDTMLDVGVKVPHSVLVSLARDIGADWDIDYELNIILTVDLPVVGNINIPVNSVGEIKLPTLSSLFGSSKTV